MTGLTVITLTRNRLEKVRRLIDRLLPQLAAGDEILLIDTGSTDGTRERLAELNNPQIRGVYYDGPGSWAEMRNFGVRHARGGMIAFLDDDCLPDPDWAARGKAGLLEADAVGGMVRSLGIHAFPRWWHPEMGWMVGLSVPGQAGPDAGRVHYPFTANLWARASVCRAVPFQEVGGQLGGEESKRYRTGREDAQWWRRLRTLGFRTRFDPKLGVGHAIDHARLDLDYLRRRARMDGRAWAVREGTREDFEWLAYQWWRQLFISLGAALEEPETRPCHWHYHRLTFERHGAALRGLREKFGSTPGLMLKALGRLGWDHAKRAARTAAAPLARSRPVRRQPVTLERVAVIAFGYLGDMVILQSALRGMMKENPWLEVYVVTSPNGAMVLRDVRRLNVTATPADVAPGGREARAWLANWLDRLDPDVIFAPYLHEPWGGTLTAMRRPPRPVYGFDSDQGLRRMIQLERLGVRVRKNLEFHESENLCALFKAGGIECAPQPAMILPTAGATEAALEQAWLAARRAEGRPVMMLNPDAAHAQKEWPTETWIDFVGLLMERTSAGFVFNANKARPELEALAEAHPERVHLLRGAGVAELIAWMAECAALVTVDSGPQHLAHALGVPSVTLYGPMDERRWRDRFARPIHRTVRACPHDLTPEERRGLPVGWEVAQIRPEAVLAELLTIMPESVEL